MSSRKGQREAARMVRQQIAREKRRKRTLWTTIGAVLVLLIAGGIGWAVYSSQKPTSFTTPPGANSDGTGIVEGGGPVTIDLYEDYQCPACRHFQEVSGPTVKQLVSEGKAKVVFHPVAFLNRFSTTEYSTRSSAAAGCAAKGGKFTEFTDQLFAKQPPENSAGLSNAELIDIGAGVGLNKDDFGSCVNAGTYKSWTEHVTDNASKAGVTGTPTIKVNGYEIKDPPPTGSRRRWRRPTSDPRTAAARGAVVTAALAALLALATPAAAHGADAPDGTDYRAEVSALSPAPPGLSARIVEAGARLEVTNTTGRDVEVLGYSGSRTCGSGRTGCTRTPAPPPPT